MEFRLTYDGLLLASNTGRDEKAARKAYKHTVRKRFHSQLRRLWETVPHLRTGHGAGEHVIWSSGGPPSLKYDAETVANKHAHYGWNFVPLVTQELRLSCWIDVLFLRRQAPGALFVHGDIDNRLKTLFDCLQVPDVHQGYEAMEPAEGDRPFFCLLENDKLISKVTVETDVLLEDVAPKVDENDARLVITVRLRLYEMTFLNLQFG